MKTLFVIPARLASTRFPEKILFKINGKTLLEHAVNNLKRANISEFVVACDDNKIAELCNELNVKSILTDPQLPTGTDRVSAAIQNLDIEYDYIVNMQGDLVYFDASKLNEIIDMLISHPEFDIGTVCIPINEAHMISSPSTVKVAISIKEQNIGKALFFSRSPIPYGDSRYYQHLGVYAFKKEAIKKFSSLKQGYLEKIEKLEQIRALENNMTIGIKILDSCPSYEINTPEDIEFFQKYLENNPVIKY